MQRIAITGSSGYIGAKLVARLASHADVESIVGVERAPLVAYLAGLAVIQSAVVIGVAAAFSRLRGWARRAYSRRAERFAGGVALLAGVLILALTLSVI